MEKLVLVCTCRFCSYEWQPHVPDPKECPRCKRRGWKLGPKVTR